MRTISKGDLINWRGLHGPAWRVILARDFASSSRPFPVSDQLVADVGRFLRLRNRGRDSAAIAAKAFPEIAQAFRLQQDNRLSDSLRMMILGELDSNEIVARSGLTKPEIGLWMEIFFDVHMGQDPLGWHVSHVVWREMEAGNFQVATNLHLALCGGPHIARHVLDGPAEIPTDPADCAEMVLRQKLVASFALSMHFFESHQELQKQSMPRMRMMLKLQEIKLAKEQRAARLEQREQRERDRELAKRSASIAKKEAKIAAQRKADEAQAQANQAAQAKREHAARRAEVAAQLQAQTQANQAAQVEREYAERQARIAGSKLLSLPWGYAEQLQGTPRAAAQGAGAAAAPLPRRPESSRRPGSPSKPAERCARTAPQVVRAAAVAVEAQDSPHPVETLSP